MLTTASADVARDLRDVKVIEPLAPFRVAVAGESGQVLLLRLEGWARAGASKEDQDAIDEATEGRVSGSSKALDVRLSPARLRACVTRVLVTLAYHDIVTLARQRRSANETSKVWVWSC